MELKEVLDFISKNSKIFSIFFAPLISTIIIPIIIKLINKIMNDIKYNSNIDIVMYTIVIFYAYLMYSAVNIVAISLLYQEANSNILDVLILITLFISCVLLVGLLFNNIRIYKGVINKFHIIKDGTSYRILFSGFKNLLNESTEVSNGTNFDKFNECTYLCNEESKDCKKIYRVQEKIIRIEENNYFTILTYYRPKFLKSYFKINKYRHTVLSLLVPVVHLAILIIVTLQNFHISLVLFSLLVTLIISIYLQTNISSNILEENRKFKIKILEKKKFNDDSL